MINQVWPAWPEAFVSDVTILFMCAINKVKKKEVNVFVVCFRFGVFDVICGVVFRFVLFSDLCSFV